MSSHQHYNKMALQSTYCTQNHIICGILHLASFTQHVFEVPLCVNMCQYFVPFYYLIVFHCVIMPHFVLDCLQFGAIINNAKNICKEVFAWTHFHFSRIGSYRGNLGSYGEFMLIFNFLLNRQTVLQSDCIVLQQCVRVPVFPCPYCHLVCLFDLAIPAVMQWYHYGFNLYFPNDLLHL